MEPTFKKEAILRSATYRSHRDALAVILKDGAMYSHNEIQDLLKEFLKKPVIEKKN